MMSEGVTRLITFIYLFSIILLAEVMSWCDNLLLEKKIYIELGHADIGIILLFATWIILSIIVVVIAFVKTKNKS